MNKTLFQDTLYLPSTPLNVLVSCALAIHNKKQNTEQEIEKADPGKPKAELWLIDQKNTQTNPYYQALCNWDESPFQDVQIFSAGENNLSKRQNRKQVFSKLELGLRAFLPKQVAVGSDRRVEFQFVMHCLQKQNQRVEGVYLDDGLYSYAGRPYNLIKDGVNALLKKLAYGFWCQEPKTIGASNWIDQAWLFSPEQAHELLKHKELHRLLPEWFICNEMKVLSQLVANQLNYDVEQLSSLDYVLLIPHPNNIKKIPGYKTRIQDLVKRLYAKGKRVAVKYHPRTEGLDPLELIRFGADEVVPAQMAFEFCLPVFKRECLVVGDIGTALLTCKWLRSDIAVIAVLDESDLFQKRFISLSRAMNVRVVNQIEDIV